MLKIKDNVDLKELEKFGWQKVGYGYSYVLYNSYSMLIYYNIWKSDRKIRLRVDMDTNVKDLEDELGVLYKLIKANLVEEVSNE